MRETVGEIANAIKTPRRERFIMESILKDLYHGNIGFDSWNYSKDSPFVKAAQRKLDNMTALTATLDNSQKGFLEGYIDAQGDIEAITRYDTFVESLKFGILFMIEILPDYKGNVDIVNSIINTAKDGVDGTVKGGAENDALELLGAK